MQLYILFSLQNIVMYKCNTKVMRRGELASEAMQYAFLTISPCKVLKFLSRLAAFKSRAIDPAMNVVRSRVNYSFHGGMFML